MLAELQNLGKLSYAVAMYASSRQGHQLSRLTSSLWLHVCNTVRGRILGKSNVFTAHAVFYFVMAADKVWQYIICDVLSVLNVGLSLLQ